MNHLPKARVIGVMVVGLLNCEAAQISAPRAATAPPAALVGDTAANGASMPVLSADGKYAAFVSRAPNLVTNPTTGKYQIFLRNLTNGGLILVSTTPAGTGGNGHSMLPSFSSSGIWIAFESDASDLVPDDTNGVTDIFIRDIGHQTTWMVTGGNGPSRNPMRSSNGCIAFDSRASNLVPDDNNNAQDVFINGGDPETTALVSVNLAGTGSADGASELLAITPNGRFVAFWSDATDIISGAVNDAGEVYVRDVQAGVSYCLTKGLGIFGNNRRLKIALTPDGQYAALQELSYGGAAPGGRLFRADVFGGSISNIYCCGWPGPGLAISDDGSRLIFPGSDGLYLRDMLSTNRLLVRDPASAFQSPLNIESFQVSRNFDRLWFTMLVTNRGQQLFSYDIATDQTSLVS
ncbi:MAG TPA: hypothetical protein VFC26_12260, partial [Verrucomicrobiae bacterium]|nr:hypothetical protein [Verrucomicrobiae bacterium]